MRKKLPVGIDDFEHLITRDFYFVDKTLMIRDLLDNPASVNLFTRPRRFGKSLNLSMIRYFFEDGRDRYGDVVDKGFLFDGMKIMDCGEEYLQHMGQYPVLQLSLKGTKRSGYESAIESVKYDIAEECRRHGYLANTDSLPEEEKKIFRHMMAQEGTDEQYIKALRFLSECLYNFHGKKTIILIDEYDVPLESAYTGGYYDEMVRYIRSFFETGLKTNPYLEFAVVTGCLRISKESIFTGMNNLRMVSVLSTQYDEYFGFTDDEVQEICEFFGLVDKYQKIKDWYNGYIFGNANVYNPWSVIYYMSCLVDNPDCFPESYWANTSSNSIVRRLIDISDREVKDEIEHLIAGGALEKPVHEDITYDEMFKSMDNLWNFMFFTGYFRKESERFDECTDTRYLTMKIPNREVHYIFREKVRGWFDEKLRRRDSSRLFSAIREQDITVMQEEIANILESTISYYDYQESFYHGFLAGILYGIENYTIKSNRESGRGRTDLFIRPASRRKPAYIFEFKIAGRMEQLENKAKEALEQIEKKHYDRELLDDGYSRIVKYGIAFFGKDCEVVTDR